MGNSSKPIKWQVSFGVTHELEYKELIEFYHLLPQRVQGTIGRKLMLAGLHALIEKKDPLIQSVLGKPEEAQHQTHHVTQEPNQIKNKPLNKKVMNLIDD